MNWLIKIHQWLTGDGEQRIGTRFRPAIAISYWSGEQVKAYPVRDISLNGLFVETVDYWGVGTSLQLHLQEGEDQGPVPLRKTSVLATIVRREVDGLGMTFLFEDAKEQRQFGAFLAGVRRRGSGQHGHSLIEFALLLPLLFLVVVNAVNFGGFFFAWITMASAARSGSQYASMAGASVTAPSPATSAQVYNVVSQDISALLNRASLAVRVCTQNFGASAVCDQTGSGTFTNPVADTRAEANLFVTTWVDVKYTYLPFIPLFNFPNLGIHATLPPTAIHRQTVMRRIQ
jgi:Flp pilus assembly protein TadG